MDFYTYNFMTRDNNFNNLHRTQNLFSQFAVDMLAKIKPEILLYIETHQNKLWVHSYTPITDHINNDGQGRGIGQIGILYSSFTDSLRYIHGRIQYAMPKKSCSTRPIYHIYFKSKVVRNSNKRPSGQTHTNRQGLLAKMFRLEIIKVMNLINK